MDKFFANALGVSTRKSVPPYGMSPAPDGRERRREDDPVKDLESQLGREQQRSEQEDQARNRRLKREIRGALGI